MARHLRQLKRAFPNGELDGNSVENAEESLFVSSLDNGKPSKFIGSSKVKYADAVSRGKSITVVVRITGGQRAAISPSMLVFKKMFRSHPNCRAVHSVPGVFYCTSPKP